MNSIGNIGQNWLLPSLIVLTAVFPGVWNGFACLSNPCIHGVCLDDLNSTYFCYCIDGYTGIQCQTNWNECWSSPCQNGGVCVDGIAMFNCSCPPGFYGELCEEDINECESNPCMNNGTCLDAQNGYTCNCPPGYSGVYCEIDVAVCNATNETRCENGGICQEGPGETFTCMCQPGWKGFLCEMEIDECLSAPCQNGAVCIDLLADYACACLFGFTGRSCEEVVQICDSSPCKNGALCLLEESHSKCYCVPDFHGDRCQYQYDECQLGPRCMNGGTCIDGIDNFTCSCPPNLTGVLCECLILGDNEFDCTYVSPKPTISYDNATITTRHPYTMAPVTIPSTIQHETTTEVPTTLIIRTDTTTDIYNITFEPTFTPFQTVTSLGTGVTYTSSLMTIKPTTELITTVDKNVTEYITNSITSTPQSEFSTVPSTSTKYFSTTEEVTTSVLESSTEKSIETTSVYSLTSTETKLLTYTPLVTQETKTSTPTELPTETSSNLIEITIPPNTTIKTSTQAEQTTQFTIFSSSVGVETNRSFPEDITTLYSSVQTFFTTEPTKKMESSTFFGTQSSVDTTTTFFTQETTTLGAFDCTNYETHCQNGGTCVYTDKGYKCICSFDTEGHLCDVKLGIRNAAFGGKSYLSHRLLNFSHINIEFEAKTMANNGLLFYSSIDTNYMMLYVENGYLKFKFSCGYQTMLLSELKVPVNNGFNMHIKAELEFSKNFKHCDATIKVNESLSMTGDQISKVDRFLNPSAWLLLGGLPEEISNDVLPVNGFIGCMSNLKVSNKRVNIYKDAEDGIEITECSSLACLSNPCKNGASCTSEGEIWQCHCRNGYLGKTCGISVCDDNPCLYGGTCIPFTNSGYICLCPYGKHGHFCENDLRISEPHFSSSVRGLSSYVAYPIPEGISRNMELKFRFAPTTMEQISLLMFIGQNGHHDFYSDHLAVSFVKGYVMLTWNLGSGPRRIFTTEPIKKGARDYLVRLGYFGRRAWLYVENLGNVTGRSPGNLVQLDIVHLLYIGGHHSRNFSLLPHDLPLHTGFSGCIFDVEIKSGSVVIPIQGSRKTLGRAVGQCGTTECYDRSCQNGGACLHHGSTFMCLCQDNWFGPLCSSKNNLCNANHTQCSESSRCIPLLSGYECDCPYGQTGQYCDKEESITDVSLTGKRSFILLKLVELKNNKFNIEMEIRILNDHGILFFVGRSEYSFVCLSLLNGLLELRIQTSKVKAAATLPLTIRSSKLLVKGVWYKVEFGIFSRKVYLSVDNIINTGLLNVGHTLNIAKEHLYLGGFPDMSEFPPTAAGSLPVHYEGCIRHLSIDDHFIPLNRENIKEARNIIDCDGTPCGGESCLNGGTCWLDSFMKPHCSCISPYYGEKCELIPKCDEKMCKNQGTCYNTRCFCNVGWGGVFCEKDIAVKVPGFIGTSYLIVKKLNDKKRNVKNLDVNKVYLNFTTANSDSLLLWSKRDQNFIGIGIENGYLKITYSLLKLNKSFVEEPTFHKVDDGLWHSLEVNFSPFSMRLDGKLLGGHPKNNLLDSNVIATNGIFYIGGIPNNIDIIKETKGLFKSNFKGCIQGFGTNADLITDFSQFEGANINVCDVF